MSLAERVSEYVRACFTGIWIESHEHDDALAEMAALCRQENWRLAVWDVDRGLQVSGQPATDAGGNDPLAAIHSLGPLAAPDSSALLVLVNFHRFLNSAEVVQALARQISVGKQQRTFVVVLSPVVQIPVELENSSWSSSTNCPAAGNWKKSPAALRPKRGNCPKILWERCSIRPRA
jgi:hypothetical protein